MQPNELTLEAQVFDAKINSMDKTCLLAPLSFFDACNVSTDEERLRRMMLLRTRALQLGISEQAKMVMASSGRYGSIRYSAWRVSTSAMGVKPSSCMAWRRSAIRAIFRQ